MAWDLMITTGSMAGERFGLHKDVVRVGSNSRCDVCVRDAGVAEHAVSIELNETGHRIYNRSTEQIIVAGKKVAAGASGLCPTGGSIQLAVGVSVQVVQRTVETAAATFDDPGDERATSSADERDEAVSRPGAPQKDPKANSTTMQVIITACCVIAGALLLLNRDSGDAASSSEAAATLTLSQLMTELDSAPDEPEWRSIRRSLQRAYRLDSAGERLDARKEYTRIVAMLVGDLSPAVTQIMQSADAVGTSTSTGSGETAASDTESATAAKKSLASIADQLPLPLQKQVLQYALTKL